MSSEQQNSTQYETVVPITVRYRDIDSVGHVNNAVYVTYLEDARVHYFEKLFDIEAESPGFVIANLSIDYLRPIQFGQEVTVGVRTTDIGTSSIVMDYEIRADGTLVATAETVVVPFDTERQSSKPVPDEWRAQLVEYEPQLERDISDE